MWIAGDIVRIASGSDVFWYFVCTWSYRLACGFDTVCDQLNLILSVSNGPISSGLSNDIDQLEQRALIPALSYLRNLSVCVEGDNVNLQPLALLPRQILKFLTHNW